MPLALTQEDFLVKFETSVASSEHSWSAASERWRLSLPVGRKHFVLLIKTRKSSCVNARVISPVA